MRTLVDIGEAELAALDRLAKEDKVSRASLIRVAIGDYLARNVKDRQSAAFGLWKRDPVDGLKFQDEIRSEW
ncbi:ribbon-helix-helix domain-containing protein [Neorhizobium alkalisoli]|uniref:ribbon-helix-helix domain-containing protein n=1 Tax=Neorhizobium alkalisoli TaxID=528178 RepID=UPI000CF96FD0|nr:CopG family transcriptional regulator [Neorhizobium alkalisoli]